jgi:hypothetical protein
MLFPTADKNGSSPNHVGGDATATNGSAPSRNGRATGRVDELEARINRLTVVCEAMWDLLSGQVGLGLDELAEAVDSMTEELADDDEHHDAETTTDCPSCGKMMPVGAAICLFCTARSVSDD